MKKEHRVHLEALIAHQEFMKECGAVLENLPPESKSQGWLVAFLAGWHMRVKDPEQLN